jgi:hypothetical protein
MAMFCAASAPYMSHLVSLTERPQPNNFGTDRAIYIAPAGSDLEEIKMRFRAILTLVTLFILTVFVACLSVAISSDALASQPHSRLFKEATERGSVSGKISAIGDASFSVDVKKSQDLVTLQFLIDDTTKVEGHLEVGSLATVDYRTDDGNNIATHVVVQPSNSSR